MLSKRSLKGLSEQRRELTLMNVVEKIAWRGEERIEVNEARHPADGRGPTHHFLDYKVLSSNEDLERSEIRDQLVFDGICLVLKVGPTRSPVRRKQDRSASVQVS